MGGFLSDAAGWRWLYWLQLILSGIIFILITFTVPETYAPTILSRRAKKMRQELSDDKYVTEMDLDQQPLPQKLRVFLFRPFQLLFLEPIVMFLSIYACVIYGLLYMFFVAFPIVYMEGKGYSSGITGLMFIPVALGVLCSAACSPLVNKHYLTLVRKHNGKPPAEARLVPMMLSCWLIPVGMFIFAWTSYPRLSWAGPALGELLSTIPNWHLLIILDAIRRLSRRLRLHLPLQQHEQLPRGQLSTSGKLRWAQST